ncbi:unnamed protein product [Blepharisma stoltei]|uniref:Uncharacterized protein n=1 Tax=Blepharisma stoltei TaxID=1481888 RepID=A0AAU9K5B3_9CILI|nr:unnamed protein product [Blepharisma stoltei]
MRIITIFCFRLKRGGVSLQFIIPQNTKNLIFLPTTGEAEKNTLYFFPTVSHSQIWHKIFQFFEMIGKKYMEKKKKFETRAEKIQPPKMKKKRMKKNTHKKNIKLLIFKKKQRKCFIKYEWQ